MEGFLIKNGFTVKDFNSNNAWGFGGARGKKYIKDGIVVTVAIADYRHTRSVAFVRVDTENNWGIVDQVNTSASRDKVKSIVTELLKEKQ